MAKASDLKKRSIVEINGDPHCVEDLKITTPSARGAGSIYRIRFRNMATKQKVDKACKGDEHFKDIDFSRHEVQCLYEAHGKYTFMDLQSYEQFELNKDDLGGQELYLVEDMEGIHVLKSGERVLGIELPPVIEAQVVECSPGMKGASATARTKPATLSSGLVVQVPEYLEPEEIVRVDTRTGEFLGRA